MTKEKYKQIIDYIKDVINGSEWKNFTFAVGGCVRDLMMGNEIKDIDLVIARPNGGILFANWLFEKELLVREPVVYEHFGTAMFQFKKFPEYEIEAVQTRKEAYRDLETRNPETAYGTLQDDCQRRDFTINALYYDITNDIIVDYNKCGVVDINNKIIRTCGNPEVIYTEDPLRILRMVRFASRFEFEIEYNTFKEAKNNIQRLCIISKERINDEFTKMASIGDFSKVKKALCLLWDLGAFRYIFPYLETVDFEKKTDLLEKVERLFKKLTLAFPLPTEDTMKLDIKRIEPTKELIIASLLYDSPAVEEEMRDLKFSNEEIDAVRFLIETNKWYFTAEEDERVKFLMLMRKCKSPQRLREVLLVGNEEVKYTFAKYTTETRNFDFYDYELPVSGDDVMEIMKIGPSKKVKEYLDLLWKFVFNNPKEKDREILIDYLKNLREYE